MATAAVVRGGFLVRPALFFCVVILERSEESLLDVNGYAGVSIDERSFVNAVLRVTTQSR
jgi:hypothetical protein